jgi:hypothetical protein
LEGNWKKKVEEIGKKLEDYWRKLVYCVNVTFAFCIKKNVVTVILILLGKGWSFELLKFRIKKHVVDI